MSNILLIGAGRSSSYLIDYLVNQATRNQWLLRIGDVNHDLIHENILNSDVVELIFFDINDDSLCKKEIELADIVISMLPAHMHHLVVEHCILFQTNMISASYISAEVQKLSNKVLEAGVLILMETGLDPGIDHMSAKKEIDSIKEQGGELTAFKSFTGGLVAPESDNTPWSYKITWNPRNVVLAGQGVVKFIRNEKYKYIPYHGVFKRLEEVTIKGYGLFEGYANRDSLKYRDIYGIENIPTIFRGTLRRPGFSEAWNIFVQLGMTDDSYVIEDSENMTYREFLNSYLVFKEGEAIEDKLCLFLGIQKESSIFIKLEWLGIFEKTPIRLSNATPAQVLQQLIENKWRLGDHEKDMVAMQHQLEYKINEEAKKKIVSMIVIGESAQHTAMAKTVGLPLGIATKLILSKKIKLKGVRLPIEKEIYDPILKELKEYNIEFFEENKKGEN